MKSKKIITISVGISAFNEAENIRNLINGIFSQKLQRNKKITEIILASDGSTDHTIQKAKSFRNRKIKIITGAKREGKNKRLNQIFSAFTGDVLVLLDADIVLGGNNVINNIVNVFVHENNIGLVAGSVQPLLAKMLPEKAFNNYVHSLNFIKSKINNGNNIYSARGPLLALSKSFAKKIVLPKNVPDDRYVYLLCIKDGYRFHYEKQSKVFFKAAQLLSEQINQANRYHTQRESLEMYFDKNLIDREYFVPFSLKVTALFLQVIRNPLAYITMKYIQINVLFKRDRNITEIWKITNSTKNLSI